MTNKPALLFLHGWSGDAAFWAPLAKELGDFADIHAPNLPGHGSGPDLDQAGIAGMNDMAAWVANWAKKQISPEQAVFVGGYSLGGRIAAFLPQFFSDRPFRGEILFSAGLGIADEGERNRRIALEGLWRARLADDSAGFWREWYEQPLFRGVGAADLEYLVNSKKQHNINSLNRALDVLSPARHEPLGGRLLALKHFLYFAGELDEKYCEIAREIGRSYPNARVEIVPGADHLVPRRRPELCAAIIRDWIEGITTNEQ